MGIDQPKTRAAVPHPKTADEFSSRGWNLRHRRLLEVRHHLGGEQLDRAHHLVVRQAGEPEVAEDVVDPRVLHLLQPLGDHLRRSPQRRQAGVAHVIPPVPVRLAVGPVFVPLGDVAVLVHGHPDGRAAAADGAQDTG